MHRFPLFQRLLNPHCIAHFDEAIIHKFTHLVYKINGEGAMRI